jgi:hypothetical protein
MKQVGIAVVALFLGGCVYATTTGESSGTMKKRIVNSWLFRSSDLFYPSDTPRQGFVRLSPGAVKSLEGEVQDVLESIARVSDALRPQTSEYLGRPIPAVGAARVYLSSHDEPVARSSVDAKGRLEIALDARVLQALLRATLAASFRSSGADDDARVAEFIQIRRETKNARSGTALVDLFGGGDRWSDMADLEQKNQAVRGDYLGTLHFLLSHEVAHRVLGHHTQRADPRDCEAFAVREVEADKYATFMLASSIGPIGSPFGRTTGVETFFRYAYERIGFRDDSAGSSTCGYPPLESRIATAKLAEEAVASRFEEQIRAAIQRQLSTQDKNR